MFGKAMLRSVFAGVALVATVRTLCLPICIVAIGLATAAEAGDLLVAGAPTYDPATNTGLANGLVPVVPGSGVNNNGTAVGFAIRYLSGSNVGQRALRWDASGTAATELGNLGTDSGGYTNAYAYAINDAGTAVGDSQKYVGGSNLGYRAVRWDASGTAATELDNLGAISSSGYAFARAYAINGAGTAVGYSEKYSGTIDLGSRAVRWDASGTAATELGNLGTNTIGYHGRRSQRRQRRRHGRGVLGEIQRHR